MPSKTGDIVHSRTPISPLLPKPDCSTYRFMIRCANHADAVAQAQSRGLRYWGDTAFEIIEFGSEDDLTSEAQNGVVNVLSYTCDIITRAVT